MRLKPIALPFALAISIPAGARLAGADVFTVGPGGGHATIQAAIDAARARGGSNEVHVAQGTWRERLFVGDLGATGSLAVIGGYADDFGSATADAAGTVLDGGGTGPVVDATITFGTFVLSTVTVQNGGRPAPGDTILGTGGGRVFAAAAAQVQFTNVVFRGNTVAPGTVSPGRSIAGAGLMAFLTDESDLVLRDCRFEDNVAIGDSGYLDGGGAWITAYDRAHVRVEGSAFRGNAIRGAVNAGGSGLFLDLLDDATGGLTDNTFVENTATPGPRSASLSVRVRGASTPDRLSARRSRFQRNHGGQLRVGMEAGGVLFSDSLLADGDGIGVSAYVDQGQRLLLTNLTVAEHKGAGVDATFSSGKVILSNSIVFGNHPDIQGPVDTMDSNLIGEDPLFAAGSYHLRPSSPAVDTGNGTPEGGLGPLDLDRFDRVRGDAVDRGAYEGPPGCRVLWPLSDPETAACRCVTDTGLRAFRCAFTLPDVFLTADVPFEEWPPRAVSWTIHPWTDLDGPYSMQALAASGEKWRTQKWLGPRAAELKRDQLVNEPFGLELDGEGLIPLRTTLTYRRAGDKDPRRVEVEVVLQRKGP